MGNVIEYMLHVKTNVRILPKITWEAYKKYLKDKQIQNLGFHMDGKYE